VSIVLAECQRIQFQLVRQLVDRLLESERALRMPRRAERRAGPALVKTSLSSVTMIRDRVKAICAGPVAPAPPPGAAGAEVRHVNRRQRARPSSRRS
jgi:hypothetical protein